MIEKGATAKFTVKVIYVSLAVITTIYTYILFVYICVYLLNKIKRVYNHTIWEYCGTIL